MKKKTGSQIASFDKLLQCQITLQLKIAFCLWILSFNWLVMQFIHSHAHLQKEASDTIGFGVQSSNMGSIYGQNIYIYIYFGVGFLFFFLIVANASCKCRDWVTLPSQTFAPPSVLI